MTSGWSAAALAESLIADTGRNREVLAAAGASVRRVPRFDDETTPERPARASTAARTKADTETAEAVGVQTPPSDRTPASAQATCAASKRASKFGNVRTEGPTGAGTGRTYDSKSSAALAAQLDLEKKAGNIVDYADEVSIIVGPKEKGGFVRYRIDQLVLDGYTADGRMIVRMLDKKHTGFDTPKSEAKRAALRQRGWKVETI